METYFKHFDTVEELSSFFHTNQQNKLINIETIKDHGYRAWFSSGSIDQKSYYQVFEVYDCFDEYGMSNFYVGAKDRKDLIDHLYEVGREKGLAKKFIAKIIKEEDWRIKEVDHMFTDTPYTSLDSNGYIE